MRKTCENGGFLRESVLRRTMKIVRIISYLLYAAAGVLIIIDNTAAGGSLLNVWGILIILASSILLTGIIVKIAKKKY